METHNSHINISNCDIYYNDGSTNKAVPVIVYSKKSKRKDIYYININVIANYRSPSGNVFHYPDKLRNLYLNKHSDEQKLKYLQETSILTCLDKFV